MTQRHVLSMQMNEKSNLIHEKSMVYPYFSLCTQNKTKGLSTKRKPYCQNESLSNRFVMHPPNEAGAFSDYEIVLVLDGAGSGDRVTQEYCMFPGAFSVLH